MSSWSCVFACCRVFLIAIAFVVNLFYLAFSCSSLLLNFFLSATSVSYYFKGWMLFEYFCLWYIWIICITNSGSCSPLLVRDNIFKGLQHLILLHDWLHNQKTFGVIIHLFFWVKEKNLQYRIIQRERRTFSLEKMSSILHISIKLWLLYFIQNHQNWSKDLDIPIILQKSKRKNSMKQ